MGYIYVIKNEVGGLGGFKIGKTIDPFRRFKELKIGTKSSLVGLWSSARYSYIEKQLHLTYKQFRVPQSEWFALTSNLLQQVISKLNSIAEQVQLSSAYQSLDLEKPVVVSTPVTQTYVKPTPTTQAPVTQVPVPAWCGLFCAIPLFGWMVAASALLNPNTDYTNNFKLVSTLSTIISILVMMGQAEAKPLTSYQLDTPQNVSSLIN